MTCHPARADDAGDLPVSALEGPSTSTPHRCFFALPRRKACGESSELLCDGCDVVLCHPHRVKSTRNGEGLDFCPACFAPVRKAWLATLPRPLPAGQYELRVLFRQWARVNPEAFDVITLSALAPGQTRSAPDGS